jgi:cytochrome P450
MTTIVLLLILLVTGALYFLKVNHAYWRKRGVPGPKPQLIFGNMGDSFLMKKSLFDVLADIYNKYPDWPFVGIFRGTAPVLLIRDPDLIKDIMVKSFDHFHDNDLEADKTVDPLLGRNPFFLKGGEWKTVRSQLTSGFTSAKMKWLYQYLEETSEQMIKFIQNEPNAMNGNGYESKELCSRFTLNNVSSCAFGIEGRCFEDNNSEFWQISRQIFTSGIFQTLIFMVQAIFPFISKFVTAKFLNKAVENRLTTLVSKTLKYREEHGIIRNDFLHILNQLKKTCKEYEFTDVDITAHATGFYIDGFETSATAMSFLLYELAANPQVQTRLREEVCTSLKDNNNKLCYELLQKLPYLDAVLNESLRMYPPLFALGRKCTKAYTCVLKNGEPFVIEKDVSILVPLSGLHYDSKYFIAPQRFNPDRFMGADKENVLKYMYLPFGEGPRACLGQRFARLQMKIGIAYIVKNFKLSVHEKTRVPIEYDPLSIVTTPKGGLWINFESVA